MVLICFGCLEKNVGAGGSSRAGPVAGSSGIGGQGEGHQQQDKTLQQFLCLLWEIPVDRVESMFPTVQGSALCSKCQAPIQSLVKLCNNLKSVLFKLHGMFGEGGNETSGGARNLRNNNDQDQAIRKDRALVEKQLTKKILQLSVDLGFEDSRLTGTSSGVNDSVEGEGQGQAPIPEAVTVKTRARAKVSGASASAKKMSREKVLQAKNKKRLRHGQHSGKVGGGAKKKFCPGERPVPGYVFQCGVCKLEFSTAALRNKHAEKEHPALAALCLSGAAQAPPQAQASEPENNLAMQLHGPQAVGSSNQDQGQDGLRFENGTVQLPESAAAADKENEAGQPEENENQGQGQDEGRVFFGLRLLPPELPTTTPVTRNHFEAVADRHQAKGRGQGAGSCPAPRRSSSHKSHGNTTPRLKMSKPKPKRTAFKRVSDSRKSVRARAIARSRRTSVSTPKNVCDGCGKSFSQASNRKNHLAKNRCGKALGRPKGTRNSNRKDAAASTPVNIRRKSRRQPTSPETPALPVVPDVAVGQEEGENDNAMDIFHDAVDTLSA